MQIIFGLSLDGPVFPPLLQDDGAVIGQVVCGPLGFLDILEKRLGLGGNWVPPVYRVEMYRQRLKIADTGARFYSESFALDEHATAQTLLAWRDELFLAGWDFSVTEGNPQRLQDLAAVEQLEAAALPFGFPERFHQVLSEVSCRKLHISRISLAEPRAQLGKHWEKLLSVIGSCGVVVADYEDASCHAASDLGQLQAALQDGGSRTAAGDGSLVILRAESDMQAAELLSAWTGCTPSMRRLFLLPRNDNTLQRILTTCGQPNLGVRVYSSQRPILQVLSLVLDLLWEPLDPYRFIEFLSLPDTPLRKRVARKLASVVAASPGIGGEPWQQALTELQDQFETAGTEEWGTVRKSIKEWLEHERFPFVTGIPKEVLCRVARRVGQWAGGHPLREDEDQTQLKALAAQATHLADILEVQPETHVMQPQLHRLLRLVQGEGQALGEPAEAGHHYWITEPEAIRAPADETIWVGVTRLNSRHIPRSPWTIPERLFLKSASVVLPDPLTQLNRIVAGYARVARLTSKRLVLVVPRLEAAEPSEAHPFLDSLEAIFGDTIHKLEVDGGEWLCGDNRLCTLAAEEVRQRNLPRPYRYWQIAPGSLPKRDVESYSSIVKVFNAPYQWVLRYPARLKEGPIQGIASHRNLMGTLGHRVFEKLFQPGMECDPWKEADVTRLVDAMVAELLPKEGAVFLMPGHAAERRQFQRQIKRSAFEMGKHIRENGWRVVGTEKHATGALGNQDVAGYVDLLLEKDDGSLAVVDLKWTLARYLRRNFLENRACQLALYAHMLKKKTLPHVAYFSLADALLVAPDRNGFKGARLAEIPEGESLSGLVKAMRETYDFRCCQFDKGLIEVPVKGTLPDPSLTLPLGSLIDPETVHDPAEYLALVGWEEEANA